MRQVKRSRRPGHSQKSCPYLATDEETAGHCHVCQKMILPDEPVFMALDGKPLSETCKINGLIDGEIAQ